MQRKYGVFSLVILCMVFGGNADVEDNGHNYNVFDDLQSWSLSIDETQHCTMTAYAKANDHDMTPLLNTVFDFVDENQNLTEKEKEKALRGEDMDFIDNEGIPRGIARGGGWRFKACKSACKEALRAACSIYNCKRIKDKFKSRCEKNCKNEFC